MSIRKTFEAAVRSNRHGEGTLTFTAVCAGEPESDQEGIPLRFGIPLTRWAVDLYAREIQAQRAAVQQATAQREIR
jgi:hypothetical protein